MVLEPFTASLPGKLIVCLFTFLGPGSSAIPAPVSRGSLDATSDLERETITTGRGYSVLPESAVQ